MHVLRRKWGDTTLKHHRDQISSPSCRSCPFIEEVPVVRPSIDTFLNSFPTDQGLGRSELTFLSTVFPENSPTGLGPFSPPRRDPSTRDLRRPRPDTETQKREGDVPLVSSDNPLRTLVGGDPNQKSSCLVPDCKGRRDTRFEWVSRPLPMCRKEGDQYLSERGSKRQEGTSHYSAAE